MHASSTTEIDDLNILQHQKSQNTDDNKIQLPNISNNNEQSKNEITISSIPQNSHRRHFTAFELNYHGSSPKLKQRKLPQEHHPKNRSSMNILSDIKMKEIDTYQPTNTSIDLVNSFKQFISSPKSLDLIKYNPVEYLNYENTKQNYLIRNTSINLQKCYCEETVTILHVGCISENNETWLFCGYNSGIIKIFSKETDNFITKIRAEKGLNNIPITSLAYDSVGCKLVSGFQNGTVVVHDIKKITRSKVIINLSLSLKKAITHIAPFSIGDNEQNRSFGFFALDNKGKTFRVFLTKNKLRKIVNDTVVLFQNKTNVFYNIALYKLNPNIFAIGDSSMIRVVKYSEMKSQGAPNKNILHKIKSLLEIPLSESDVTTYLPSFAFLGHHSSLNSPMFCVAINNSVLVYSIDQFDLTLTLETSFSFTSAIIDIGPFSSNSLFVVDSNYNINHIDISNNKTYHNCLDLSDLNIKPLNQIECLIDTKGGKTLPDYTNMFHSLDNKCQFYVRTDKTIVCIVPKLIKEYLNELKNDKMISYEEKWKTIFTFLITVKGHHHIVYQYSSVSQDLNSFCETLGESFLNEYFQTTDPTIQNVYITTLLPMFINTLLEMELIKYITGKVKELFKEIDKLSIYYELIEIHILRDKFLTKLKDIPFILDMIDYYSEKNLKQKLSHLLLHLDTNIIFSSEQIYEKVLSNKNIYTMLSICLKNRTKNFYKPIEFILNQIENSTEQNDDNISLPIPIVNTTQTENQNEKSENKEIIFPEIEKVAYDDKTFYSKTFMKLELLWYIIKLIDIRGTEIIQNESSQIITFLINEKTLNTFCLLSNLQKEFFYVIKHIIIKCSSNKVRRRLIESIYDRCNLLSQNESDMLNENVVVMIKKFYMLCIYTFVKNPKIDFRNEIKIHAILFLLKSKFTVEEEAAQIEDMIINVMKELDYITNDDSIALVKACEDSELLKAKNYIKETIHI